MSEIASAAVRELVAQLNEETANPFGGGCHAVAVRDEGCVIRIAELLGSLPFCKLYSIRLNLLGRTESRISFAG